MCFYEDIKGDGGQKFFVLVYKMRYGLVGKQTGQIIIINYSIGNKTTRFY